MPDPIPVAPAAVAAAPTPAPSTPTPPAPAAAPATPPAPERTNRQIADNLANLLTAKTPDAVAKVEAPKPAAEAPKPKEEKPIKVPKKKEPESSAPTPPAVPKRAAAPAPEAKPAPAAPAPVAAKEVSDEEFEKSLLEEEKSALDDARAAEQYGGDKYKGFAKRQRDFLRENAKKAADVEKGDLDEADYKEWHAKHNPAIARADLRTIERARIREDLRKDFEPQIEAERHERWAGSEAPKIKHKGDAILAKLQTSVLPDEVMAAIADRTAGVTDRAEYVKRVNEIEKEYALEFEVTNGVIAAATDDMEEFHRLVTINPATGKPLKLRNRDDKTPEGQQHARIAKIAADVCDDFKANGGTALQRNGKWFCTWKEQAEMEGMVRRGELSEEEFAKWWSFSADDITDRALANVKPAIAAEIKRRDEEISKRGYTRNRPTPAPVKPAAPQPPGAPPAPRATPPPAGGGNQPLTAGGRLANLLG